MRKAPQNQMSGKISNPNSTKFKSHVQMIGKADIDGPQTARIPKGATDATKTRERAVITSKTADKLAMEYAASRHKKNAQSQYIKYDSNAIEDQDQEALRQSRKSRVQQKQPQKKTPNDQERVKSSPFQMHVLKDPNAVNELKFKNNTKKLQQDKK